jgi:hypothetical protein
MLQRPPGVAYNRDMFGIGHWELLFGLACLAFFALGAVVLVVTLASRSQRPSSSLMPCPDCGQSVSPLARICPNCGRPLK